MAKKLPKFFHCPAEFTLAVLGGKWKTVILCFLKERPCRYTELRKLLPKLSDKMLTERLHDPIAAGLVVRRRRIAGPAQEYMLAALGYHNNMEYGESAGFNDGKNTDFWTTKEDTVTF